MLYNYCYIIVQGDRVVKELYLEEKKDKSVIKFKWSDKLYEALPFLTKPDYIEKKVRYRHLPLYVFYYTSYEDGIPFLRETFPKPFARPNEYDTKFAAKKAAKLKLNEEILLLKERMEKIQQLIKEKEKNHSTIDFLEVEED